MLTVKASSRPANPKRMDNALKLPISYQEIAKILPHRYPFLMIDRITELEPDKRIVALKNVSANEPYFSGHFPGTPVMPGVLQIEAMAQAGGVLAYFSKLRSGDGHVTFLASISDVRFRKAVVPGDQLELRVEQISRKSSILKIRGQAFVDGENVSEATIVAVSKEYPG